MLGGMNTFAALLDRLERTPRDDVRARLLASYFKQTPAADRGVALGLLTGAVNFKFAPRGLIGELAAERLDPVLYDLSQELVGDARETVALMWPATPGANRPPTLADIAEALCETPDAEANHAHLPRWLAALDANARRVLLTLVTGRISPAISPRLLRDALAQMSGRALTDIEAIWHAVAPPYDTLFAWLDGDGPSPAPATEAPFHALASVRQLTDDDRAGLDLSDFAVEPLWDGVRVLAVTEGETRRLYTHTGDDISHAFPDLIAAMTFEGAVDGVLQLRDAAGSLLPKSTLRQRINRTSVTKKILSEQRPLLRMVDALRHGHTDVRGENLHDRRAALTHMMADMASDLFTASIEPSPTTWTAIDTLRSAPPTGARGVVLKAWDARYGVTPWLVWARERDVRDMVLLYVERAATPDALACTVGVWRTGDDGDELVPIGTVDAHGEARQAIAAFARANAADRFGPVTQVTADADTHVVVTVAFEGLVAAPRKKAKAQLRAPQLVRINDTGTLDAISRLEELATQPLDN